MTFFCQTENLSYLQDLSQDSFSASGVSQGVNVLNLRSSSRWEWWLGRGKAELPAGGRRRAARLLEGLSVIYQWYFLGQISFRTSC